MKTENSRKITGTALCLCAVAVLAGCSKESDFGGIAETTSGIVFEVNVAGDQEAVVRTRSTLGIKVLNENLSLCATLAENEENPFTTVRSRATEVTADAFYDTFGAYAYIYDSEENWADSPSAKLYIDKGTVTQSGGSWAFDAVRYRPSEAYRLTFFAYAPTALEETTDGSLEVSLDESSNLPQIAYTVPSSYAEQKDLVVATAKDQTGSENSVSLDFAHILTAVQVKCGSVPDGTVSSVSFSGIKSQGTYDLAEGCWTLADDTTSYEVDGAFTASSSAEILTEGYTLMLLPQRLGEDAAVTVKFTPTDGEEITLTASLYQEDLDEGEQEWEAGTMVTYNLNFHGAVDLGLPSGVKWATCNVGASSETDYGNYYAFGEISTKSSYSTSNSTWYGKSVTEATIKGNPLYDAATANWGGSWRLPTSTEISELINTNNTTHTAHTKNGVKGVTITSITNGNSIFFPCSGCFTGTGITNKGTTGWIKTCTQYDKNNYYYDYTFKFGNGAYTLSHAILLYVGNPVRPVTD
ncbi:MAG: fimbrillin family protein, partial [Porphyromonadaceae bacterium]|nr:fimbrillin family protein [Porphyromonadaceae bacterium]